MVCFEVLGLSELGTGDFPPDKLATVRIRILVQARSILNSVRKKDEIRLVFGRIGSLESIGAGAA
jgi:hypothetical protein